MPFDCKGLHGAVSVKATRGKLRGETAPMWFATGPRYTASARYTF